MEETKNWKQTRKAFICDKISEIAKLRIGSKKPNKTYTKLKNIRHESPDKQNLLLLISFSCFVKVVGWRFRSLKNWKENTKKNLAQFDAKNTPKQNFCNFTFAFQLCAKNATEIINEIVSN